MPDDSSEIGVIAAGWLITFFGSLFALADNTVVTFFKDMLDNMTKAIHEDYLVIVGILGLSGVFLSIISGIVSAWKKSAGLVLLSILTGIIGYVDFHFAIQELEKG